MLSRTLFNEYINCMMKDWKEVFVSNSIFRKSCERVGKKRMQLSLKFTICICDCIGGGIESQSRESTFLNHQTVLNL